MDRPFYEESPGKHSRHDTSRDDGCIRTLVLITKERGRWGYRVELPGRAANSGHAPTEAQALRKGIARANRLLDTKLA